MGGEGQMMGEVSVTEPRRKAGRPRGRIRTRAVSCRLPEAAVAVLMAEALAAGRSVAAVLAEAVCRGRPDWWASGEPGSGEAEGGS